MISHLTLPYTIVIPFLNFPVSEISVYSLFMVMAFVAGRQEAMLELHFRRLPWQLADRLTAIGILAGLAGGRIFFLYEVRHSIGPGGDTTWFEVLTGNGGFVFYGGLLFSIGFSWLYLSLKKYPVLSVADGVAPAMALGYGIGRLGCAISGDGCFGIHSPLDIPFLTITPGPLSLVSTGGVRVYNTPLMEALLSFLFYLKTRRKIREPEPTSGTIFYLFLMWNGAIRFLVEFLRTNEPLVQILPAPDFLDRWGIRWALDPAHKDTGPVGLADFYRNWYWSGPTISQLIGLALVGAGIWFFATHARKRLEPGFQKGDVDSSI